MRSEQLSIRVGRLFPLTRRDLLERSGLKLGRVRDKASARGFLSPKSLAPEYWRARTEPRFRGEPIATTPVEVVVYGYRSVVEEVSIETDEAVIQIDGDLLGTHSIGQDLPPEATIHVRYRGSPPTVALLSIAPNDPDREEILRTIQRWSSLTTCFDERESVIERAGFPADLEASRLFLQIDRHSHGTREAKRTAERLQLCRKRRVLHGLMDIPLGEVRKPSPDPPPDSLPTRIQDLGKTLGAVPLLHAIDRAELRRSILLFATGQLLVDERIGDFRVSESHGIPDSAVVCEFAESALQLRAVKDHEWIAFGVTPEQREVCELWASQAPAFVTAATIFADCSRHPDPTFGDRPFVWHALDLERMKHWADSGAAEDLTVHLESVLATDEVRFYSILDALWWAMDDTDETVGPFVGPGYFDQYAIYRHSYRGKKKHET